MGLPFGQATHVHILSWFSPLFVSKFATVRDFLQSSGARHLYPSLPLDSVLFSGIHMIPAVPVQQASLSLIVW